MSGTGSRFAVGFILTAALLAGGWLRFRGLDRYAPDECERGDAWRYYVSTAESFLAGRGFTPDYEWNFIPPPLEAVFVIGVRTISPQADYRAVRDVQAWISLAAIVLAFAIGVQLHGQWVGAAAAVLVALDPHVAAFATSLLAESNYFVLLLAFLALLPWGLRSRSVALCGASGAVLGLAALAKPFPMYLAVLCPAYILLRYRDRRRAAGAAALAGAFVLVLAPWVARNHARYGGWYLISTNAGVLLAQSNFAALDASDEGMVYWDSIYSRDIWQDSEIEARFAGRTDREGRREWNERDRAYLAHALRYIAGHPAHFARNYVIKFGNAFVYPRPPEGAPWGLSDWWRLIGVWLGVAGFVAFVLLERHAPAYVLVPIFLYFAGFTALMHLTRDGRMNLPMRVLLSLFTAYLLGRAVENLLARPPALNREGAVVQLAADGRESH